MQDGTVGWDPVINREPGPLLRVYVLFLFLVLAVIMFRAIRLTIYLRRFEKFSRIGEAQSNETQQLLQRCNIEVHSMKRWSAFTLRAATFVALVGAANMLREVINQKVLGTRALGGTLREICVQLAVGLLIVLVADTASGYFEGAIERRSMTLNRSTGQR